MRSTTSWRTAPVWNAAAPIIVSIGSPGTRWSMLNTTSDASSSAGIDCPNRRARKKTTPRPLASPRRLPGRYRQLDAALRGPLRRAGVRAGRAAVVHVPRQPLVRRLAGIAMRHIVLTGGQVDDARRNRL